MTSVNALIPLSVDPRATAGPDIGQIVRNQLLTQKVRENNRAMQAQNALRQLYSDPSNIDSNGNPTPDALRKIMAIDPATGMQVQTNMLRNQEMKVQTDSQKTELFAKKFSMVNTVNSEALTAYEDALKGGTPKDQAMSQAQKIYSDGLTNLRQSGLFSDQDMSKAPTAFDPLGARSRVMTYQQWQATQEKEKADVRADKGLKLQEAAGARAAAAEGRAETEFKEKQAGLGLSYKAIDEAARDYITSGKLPTGASRKEIARIIDRAPELRKQGIGPAKEFGNPVPVQVTNPDGTKSNTMAVYDKDNAQWLEASGRKPISGQVTPAKEARDQQGLISDQTADFIADRILANDPNATRNLSRNKDTMAKVEDALTRKAIQKFGSGERAATELMIGMAAVKGDQSSLNNLTKMTDAATSFEETANKNFDLALSLSDKAVPTNWGPFVNRWVMKGETELGNKDVPPYVTAMLTGANEYAKIMSGSTGAQGSTVDSRREAAELFSPYLANGQIEKVIKIAKLDMNNRKNSLNEKIQEIKDRMGSESGKPQTTAAATPGSTTAPKLPDKLKGIPGLQYSPSRKQYKDPATGTVYDAEGNQVR